MIAIIDCGVGNLGSIVNMLRKIGADAAVISDPSELVGAEKLILPGVGSFDHGMAGLTQGWIDTLNEAVMQGGTPLLGICLGMQLLCRSSEEGNRPGLGWIDAQVRRFRFCSGSDLKIPHMGWNNVTVTRSNPLIKDDRGEQRFYFVHSYHVVCSNPEDVLATASHGYDFAVAVSSGNVFGVQFHPEKSHRFGMELLSNFAGIRCSNTV